MISPIVDFVMRIVVLLGLVAIASGCSNSELNAAKKENLELKAQVALLHAEVEKLKETADFVYKKGQEQLKANELEGAAKSFEDVIRKYPNDPLVGPARTAHKEAIEMIERKAAEAAKENEVKAEAYRKEIAESGEEIEYAAFYAKSQIGLPIGKRFRFNACVSSTATCIENTSKYGGQSICDVEPQFEDSAEYENFLRVGRPQCGVVVVSLLHGGRLAMHRLH